MPVPVVPDCYIARSTGLFPLWGGPLCGLYTDETPIGIDMIIHLDHRNRRGKHTMCSYQLQTEGPRAPFYLCVGEDRVAWG